MYQQIVKSGASPAFAALERIRTRLAREDPVHEGTSRLLVGAGSCAAAVGSSEVTRALHQAVSALDANIEIVESGCSGMCGESVQITRTGSDHPDVTWSRVTPDQATRIVEIASGRRPLSDLNPTFVWQRGPHSGVPGMGDTPFLAGQRRLLLEHAGRVDPTSLSDALRRDGYRGLATALSMSPLDVLEIIGDSGLTGRGGAYFPVGLKLSGCRNSPGLDRVLVVNAEEGEPGVFKDRHLIEGDPHLVIEGALIAAYAMGAGRVIIYVNGQARLSLTRLTDATAKLREHRLIETEILDTDFSCQIEVRVGAGGYVLGEETAMLESIEGRRSMPRVRPPFPFEEGLWRRPTAVQNVETVANLPLILRRGGEWFRQFGTSTASGTKLICISGTVRHPGVAEVEFGTTLRRLLFEIGGGMLCERQLQAVLSGGPSGFLIPPEKIDSPLEPRNPDSFLGSGNLLAIDESVSLYELVRRLTRFNANESCGKCTPCREGLARLAANLDRIATGETQETDRDDIDLLCEVAANASLCGLGQMAPNPVRSLFQHFSVPELRQGVSKAVRNADA